MLNVFVLDLNISTLKASSVYFAWQSQRREEKPRKRSTEQNKTAINSTCRNCSKSLFVLNNILLVATQKVWESLH